MDAARRRELGAFYTPPEVVDALLDEVLEPELAVRQDAEELLKVRVLDPACGDGAFLVAAARRIAARLSAVDGSRDEGDADALGRVVSAGCVRGADIDPVAIEACASALGSSAPLRLGDALVDDSLFDGQGQPDVVVGNPPFLNQLDLRTAVDPARRAALQERYPMEPYTDLSALFYLRAVQLVREGGRVIMVQPLSVLAARDARGVREAVAEQAAVISLWVAGGRVFPNAEAQVCAIGVRKGAASGPVHLTVGGGFRDCGSVPAASWAALGAQAMGIPTVDIGGDIGGGTREAGKQLGDIATVTADFREAFYRLATVAQEGAGDEGARRIASTGMIDPAVIRWGEQEVRFAGERYRFPIAASQGPSDQRLDDWIAQRGVPKVLLATQTRVLEAAMDPDGAYLPVTPVISVVPKEAETLSRIAAVLLSPVATALTATEGFGTALSPLAIKVSAAQVRALPLPRSEPPWNEAAALIESAHRAEHAHERLDLLEHAGRSMMEAYGLTASHPVYPWWRDRLRSASRRRSLRPNEKG